MDTKTATTDSTPWPNVHYAWYTVIVLNLAYGLAVLDRIIIGLMVDPIKRDLGLSDTQMGLLQGLAFAIFYTACSFPIGYLVDRWRRVRLLSMGVSVWSAATFACGYANSFAGLFIARVAVGVGEAVVTPASSSIVSDYFRPENRAKAFSVLMLGGTFGTALAYFVGGTAIQVAGELQHTVALFQGFSDWQIVFMMVGIPGLFIALLLLFTVREPVRREQIKKDGDSATLKETFAYIKKNKGAYFTLMGGAILSIMVINAAIAWYPSVFIRVYEWTPAKTGLWFSIIGLCCGSFSALSGGWVMSYFSKKGYLTAPIWAVLLQSIFWLIFGTYKSIAPTAELSLIAHVGTGVSAVWAVTAVLTGLNQITPNEMRGQVVAIYTVMSGIFGMTLGTASVGILSDYVFTTQDGIAMSLASVYASGSILSILIIVIGWKTFARASEEAKAWKK